LVQCTRAETAETGLAKLWTASTGGTCIASICLDGNSEFDFVVSSGDYWVEITSASYAVRWTLNTSHEYDYFNYTSPNRKLGTVSTSDVRADFLYTTLAYTGTTIDDNPTACPLFSED